MYVPKYLDLHLLLDPNIQLIAAEPLSPPWHHSIMVKILLEVKLLV